MLGLVKEGRPIVKLLSFASANLVIELIPRALCLGLQVISGNLFAWAIGFDSVLCYISKLPIIAYLHLEQNIPFTLEY